MMEDKVDVIVAITDFQGDKSYYSGRWTLTNAAINAAPGDSRLDKIKYLMHKMVDTSIYQVHFKNDN